jgi:hypothetical protein
MEKNEYEQRLIDALKELSIVSSNSAIPWVRSAASKGYNAISTSVITDNEDHSEFFKEVYGM